MPQERSTVRNKKNEGQHSRENNRKMGREEDAWTIATYLDETWWILKIISLAKSWRH
jgi:hypothetical protein